MKSDLVYDIGMHNGDDSAYYLSKGYKVVAIDASPTLVEQAKARFADAIAEGRLEILNIGIGASEAVMDFYLNKTNSVWNSFDQKIGRRANSEYEVILVHVKPVTSIMKEKGVPHYMKIDIEGNDILCLHSILDAEEKPRYISAEITDTNEIEKMRDLGYTKFKLIDQNSFLPLELPAQTEYAAYLRHKSFTESRAFATKVVRKLFRKRLNSHFERSYKKVFSYDHPFGSSGPFGEGLPGRWLGFDEAVNTYLHYRQVHEASGTSCGYDFWNDVHATKD